MYVVISWCLLKEAKEFNQLIVHLQPTIPIGCMRKWILLHTIYLTICTNSRNHYGILYQEIYQCIQSNGFANLSFLCIYKRKLFYIRCLFFSENNKQKLISLLCPVIQLFPDCFSLWIMENMSKKACLKFFSTWH